MNAVYSMTGFASLEGELEEGRGFSLTIKSVNHRHLDPQFRLPGGLDALEPGLRKVVKGAIRRGHVEVIVGLQKATATQTMELDEAMLAASLKAFHRACEQAGVRQDPDLNELLRLPGVMTAAARTLDVASIERTVLARMAELLERFNAARCIEGLALAEELRAGMKRVGELAEEARALRAGVADAELERLKGRMAELLAGADVSQERLVTEAALLAARGDVEEELVRLRTHLDRFAELLDGGGEVGRALDFLLQELNREANTLLSKTGGSAGEAGLRLTEIGLAVKVELERAREQVQNLE